MARPRTLRRHLPPPATALAPPTGIRWRAAIIVLAGFLAYANSFSGPFVLDDRASIVENAQIRDVWRLESVLFPRRELPTAGRPLVNLSFAVNYALGGLDVRGYHLVNLAFHLLCGLLVFGIVRRTLDLPALKGLIRDTSALNLGFAAALLWTLHPLNTEAVNYVTQRTELMMAVFYLLTLYAGIRALGSSPGSWRAIAVLSCGAGMLCKESMVTAPVVVVLYDVIFVFVSFRRALGERWRFYMALCASWIVLAAVMWSGPRVRSAGFSIGVDPWTYLLNQAVMITQYLRLAVWPRALVVNYGWPLELTLRDVLPYALFVTALLALTAVAVVRQPKWGFLGAWFFVTLALTSSIVPIATEVGAERRMYLPLIALVVLAVVSASFVKRASSALGSAALVMVALLFAVGTFTRNREYVSELRLARTIIERHPTPVGHHILGTVLLSGGDRDEGMSELRHAIPGAPRAHFTLGVELFKEAKMGEAIEQFELFLRAQPNLLEAISARQLLGQALAQQGRWAEAIEHEQKALTMNPSEDQRLDTHALLAAAYIGAENFKEAIAHSREYLRWRPDSGPALTRLGIALSATGELVDAIAAFRRAAAVAPEDADAQRNLAIALSDHGDFQDALTHAQQVVALRPGDAEAHRLVGRLLARLGKFDEARSHFERSLQIDPADAEAKETLRTLQAVAGR
jgi:tetratricopeptide (TPR) repeat protein